MMKAVVPLLCSASLLLAGCAATPAIEDGTSYDLGSNASAVAPIGAATLPTLSLAEISAAGWLDSSDMVYRLSYAEPQQPRPYAHSRWSMPPAQLLEQQLKAQVAAAGGVLVAASDNPLGLPLLRLDLLDFSQDFSAPAASRGVLKLRATVFVKRVPVAQKTFQQQQPAPSADAAGAARALAVASNQAIAQLLQWLAQLPLRQ